MKNVGNQIRQSREDKLFDVINYSLLGLVFLICAYPLVFVLSASVSDPAAVASGRMCLFLVGLNLNGYAKILQYDEIWRGYANTIFITVVGTTINLVMTILFAYPLSRSDFRGRELLTGMITLTMFFPAA